MKWLWLLILLGMQLYAAAFYDVTVLEHKKSGGYTYLYVDDSTSKFWAAVPEMEVKKGDKLSLNKQMWVQNFYSKTLDETFDALLFAMIKKDKVQINVDFQKKKEGYLSVAEVFEKAKELEAKEVQVNGVITKVSYGILGYNWVHIQDTTKYKTENDLIFLLHTNNFKEGDRVNISGKVTNNRDFGAGYKYKVIVDEAKII